MLQQKKVVAHENYLIWGSALVNLEFIDMIKESHTSVWSWLIRVDCGKRLTFRGLFSKRDVKVILEDQFAQMKIFKYLNPIFCHNWE